MPWLPYFINCNYQSRFIMLNDVILCSECFESTFEEVVCSNKDYSFDCVIEEYKVGTIK